MPVKSPLAQHTCMADSHNCMDSIQDQSIPKETEPLKNMQSLLILRDISLKCGIRFTRNDGYVIPPFQVLTDADS